MREKHGTLAPTADLIGGNKYALYYEDGSRVVVNAKADSRGDVDVESSLLDFFMWVGSAGDPQNREGIKLITQIEEEK